MAEAWRSDAFEGYTFKDFIRVARCKLDVYQPEPTPCTVSGKPALNYGHNSQYNRVQFEGRDFLMNAHPLDVLPVGLRPTHYQHKGPQS